MVREIAPERGEAKALPLLHFSDGSSLCAEDLEVSRGGTRVLRRINLVVRPGASLAVVGPNGSGKSTLLLALRGFLAPTAGRVFLGEERVSRGDPRIGLVLPNPEDQGVAPVVQDDVAFGLENLGCPPDAIRVRVEGALRAVGLWHLRSASLHTLSGGQLQQVALAGVLAMGAGFALLDEATSMLSPWGRDGWMLTLGTLRRRGLGIVLVTHEPEELLWADEVLALDGGETAYQGPVAGYFASGVCPWKPPPFLSMVREMARLKVAPPPYSEVVAWSRGGP